MRESLKIIFLRVIFAQLRGYIPEGYIRPITVALIYNDNRGQDSDKGRESGVEGEEEEEEERESHAKKI